MVFVRRLQNILTKSGGSLIWHIYGFPRHQANAYIALDSSLIKSRSQHMSYINYNLFIRL